MLKATEIVRAQGLRPGLWGFMWPQGRCFGHSVPIRLRRSVPEGVRRKEKSWVLRGPLYPVLNVMTGALGRME
jgi:hypothetical protein